MVIEVLQADPDAIDYDHAVAVADPDYVYEHVKYMFRNGDKPIPLIGVELIGGRLRATRSLIFLAVARELHYKTVNITLANCKFEQLKSLNIPGILSRLSEDQVKHLFAKMECETSSMIFFDKAPSADHMAKIQNLLEDHCELLRSSILDGQKNLPDRFTFNPLGPCLEFRHLAPYENIPWNQGLLRLLIQIDAELSRIESYNGYRFSKVRAPV
jgi:hypothetical protein